MANTNPALRTVTDSVAINVTTDAFTNSGPLDGIDNGVTVTAISSDGVHFTPVTTTDPGFTSSATVDGRYLAFSVNADGTAQELPVPNAQAVVDAIQANEGATRPLTDTLYYQVSDGVSTTTDQMIFNLNDVTLFRDFAPLIIGAPPIAATPRTSSGTASTAATPAPDAIVVGGGSPYATIQQGIAAAERAGSHTVLVSAGAYTENDVIGAADDGLTIATVSGGVTLAGSISLTDAANVTISGLTFQGDGSTVAITSLGGQALTVTQDSFAGTGQAVMLDRTTDSTLSANLMETTTGSAIELKDGASGATLDSNVIDGVGAQNTVGAIWLHGSSGDSITHNQITNTLGAGISLTDFSAPGTTATQNENDLIADNSLSHVDTASKDSGAIYILGRSQAPQTGDVVMGNLIANIGSSTAPNAHAVGIYLDDNASGVTVTQNIVQATPTMTDVYEIHGGSNDTISGNIFDTGAGATDFGLFQADEADQLPQGSFAQLQNDKIQGNIFTTESAAPHNPAFGDLTNGIGAITISGNDFWSYGGAPLNVAGRGPTGDTGADYTPPARHPATSLGDYASWGDAAIGFMPIDTANVFSNTSTLIQGLMVDKALATGQTSDASEPLSVTLTLQDANGGQANGTLSVDLNHVGADGSSGEAVLGDGTASLTIVGSIAQINANLLGLTYNSGASGGDQILFQAVDGPSTTQQFVAGAIDTVQSPSTVYQAVFATDPTYGDSQLPLQGVPAGATITGISTDGLTYVPVSTTDPNYGTSTTLYGSYLSFHVNADGTAIEVAYPDTRSVADAIQGNERQSQPLNDQVYYQVTSGGATVVEETVFSLTDLTFNIAGLPFSLSGNGAVETVAPNASTTIAGLSVHKVVSSGQRTDAADPVSVVVRVLEATGQNGGTLRIDPTRAGSAGGTGETITTDPALPAPSVRIDGTIAQVNADLEGLTYDSRDPGSVALGVQAVDGPFTTHDFVLGEITTACYCPGTRIATARGATRVEDLAIGDCIATLHAGERPIKWIGRRTYDGRFVARQVLMLPVCVKADALAHGVPVRDLWVSPGHGLYIDGALTPAWRLVNGRSIVQAATVDQVSYLHIELDTHEVIFAEGCPAESFIDDRCRQQFHNAAEYTALYGTTGAAVSPCAPRVEAGFGLQAAHARLAARAGVAPTPPGLGRLHGFIDQAGPTIVSGWAQDVAYPEAPVCLDIVADGVRVARVLANAYRADLREARLGSGCHAFTHVLDQSYGAIEVRRSIDGVALRPTDAALARAA